MSKDYDAIVVGLGAMGSAAAYHLARNGQRVLGLDRFHPPHNLGSSHGLSRIIREAYFEDPVYVPLVQRAYDLWADLETKSGKQLMLQTGGLMIGPADGILVSGAKRSAREHHLAHRILSASELRLRFAPFKSNEAMVAVWEPRAGILFPELAIRTHLEMAASHGAVLQFNDPVVRWEAAHDGVLVHTQARSFTARGLLMSAGAWTKSLLPDLQVPLTVERQVLFWFEALSNPEHFQPKHCPVFICEYAPGQFFYGLPDTGDGLKVAFHHQGECTDPDGLRRDVAPAELAQMRELLARFLPSANGRLKSTAVCMYTNTPDEHFLFDQHPLHPRVLIASPCSGHGFKFSPVIGQLAAAWMQHQTIPLDLTLFRLQRFGI
jgi:sarcosine oxidase